MNIVHNTEKHTFTAYTDNDKQMGQIEYEPKAGTLIATHTHVSADFQGQGIGVKLLDALVAYAISINATITPVCSYVQSAFQKHPEKYSRVAEIEFVSMIEAAT